MTLGDIGRPTVDQFDGFRRLILVPFVTISWEDAELQKLIDRYWEDAAAQVHNLEARLGVATQIYLEGSVVGGDTEVEALVRASPAAVPFVRDTVSRGATLRRTEDPEPLLEAVDLQRCLMVTQASSKVAKQLHEWLEDARKRRYETIAARIDETLPSEGVGVLIISQDHRVQFAPDIRVFYVAPPALNQIDQWVRDNAALGSVPDKGKTEPSQSEPIDS